jgi:hypothetical protein
VLVASLYDAHGVHGLLRPQLFALERPTSNWIHRTLRCSIYWTFLGCRLHNGAWQRHCLRTLGVFLRQPHRDLVQGTTGCVRRHGGWGLTIHSSRTRFASRLNSGVRPAESIFLVHKFLKTISKYFVPILLLSIASLTLRQDPSEPILRSIPIIPGQYQNEIAAGFAVLGLLLGLIVFIYEKRKRLGPR